MMRPGDRAKIQAAKELIAGGVPIKEASGAFSAYLSKAMQAQSDLAGLRASIQWTKVEMEKDHYANDLPSIRAAMAADPEINKTEAKHERYRSVPSYRNEESQVDNLQVLDTYLENLHWMITRIVESLTK